MSIYLVKSLGLTYQKPIEHFQCLKDGDIINVVCCSEMSNSEIAKINCTFKAVVDSIALPDMISNLDDWKP